MFMTNTSPDLELDIKQWRLCFGLIIAVTPRAAPERAKGAVPRQRCPHNYREKNLLPIHTIGLRRMREPIAIAILLAFQADPALALSGTNTGTINISSSDTLASGTFQNNSPGQVSILTGGSLDINSGAAFSNSSALDLTGTLNAYGNYSGSSTSTFNVHAGGTLFGLGNINNGGAITNDAGGIFRPLHNFYNSGTVSNSGTLNGPMMGYTFQNTGSISNDGSFTIGSYTGTSSGSITNGTAGTLTLQSGQFSNSGSITNAGLITGGATLVNSQPFSSILNQGTISGVMLDNYGTVTNSTGASLNAYSITLQEMARIDNDGAITTASINGGNWSQVTNRSSITLTSSGTNSNQLAYSGASSSSLTLSSNATYTNAAGVSNAGAFSNGGTFTNNSTFSHTGGSFTNSRTFSNASDLNLTGGSFANSGSLTNTATLTADGLGMQNTGTLTNGSAGSFTLGTSGAASLVNAVGGTLTNEGQLRVRSLGTLTNYGTVNGLGTFTNDGSLSNESGSTLSALHSFSNTGTFTNKGSFSGAATYFTFSNLGTINNDGNFRLNGATATNTGTFNNNAGATLRLGGGYLTNSNSITNNGQIANFNIINSAGSLVNNGAMGTSDDRYGSLDNRTTFSNNTGASLYAYSLLTNNSSQITNNGSIYSLSGVTLTNAGSWTDSGLLQVTGQFVNAGQMDKTGGTLQANAISSSRNFNISSGATVTSNTTFDQTGATLTVNGNLLASQVSLSNGTLNGSGFVSGLATLANVWLSPGNSPGTLTFNSATTLNGGHLVMEIASLASHDKIVFNGLATFQNGPELDLSFLSGYTPVGGNWFDLFDFNGGVSGTLSLSALPTLTGGLYWDTSRLYTTGEIGILAPVPEPAAWLMVLSGLALMLGRKKFGRP